MVDPIDGTAAYMKGRPWFTVALALVEDGQRGGRRGPRAGARTTPTRPALGGGATLNGAADPPPAAPSGWRAPRCSATPRRSSRLASPGRDLRFERRNSIALRMALVAAGEFDAAVALSPKHDWDVAAGALIAEEAGARVTDHLGRPLPVQPARAAPAPRLVCAAPGCTR